MYSLMLTNTEPSLDTTPVFKTTCYPWADEDDSFRPLAYARSAYVKDRGLLVDLQAFEREPVLGGADILDDSCLALAFNFSPESSDSILSVIANSRADYRVYLNGEPLEAALELSRYAGEDEQGWYWGVRFYIPQELLQKVCEGYIIKEGQALRGNFYKFLRAGKGAHLAAVCPLPSGEIMLQRGDLGVFCAAAY